MDIYYWMVVLSILVLIGLIIIYFIGPNNHSHAFTSTSGYQEATILVKKGYSPDRIIVQCGRPVRFEFFREEKSACSEMVIFPDFQKSAMLPVGKSVVVELPPMEEGIYDFTCQMGMYKGKVIAKSRNIGGLK